MLYLLSLLPILLLVVISLTKGVQPAVLVGWAVTSGLFFYWGAGPAQYLGAMGVSMLTTINILLIVLGAIFLYTIMRENGLIGQITQSLEQLHPSKEVRFFVLAFGLTAFFEGVAGFGTPGAIVPLILIAMGFGPALSVSVVLLFDGLFALFGAVGTPLLVGLQVPLDLPAAQLPQIGLLSAGFMSIAGLVVVLWVFRMLKQEQGELQHRTQMLVMYGFFMVPFLLLAWFAPELATVFAAIAMLGLSVVYLRKKGNALNWKPWLPYLLLALVLLLPKIFSPLRHLLGWELVFENMFGSGIRGGIKLLQSPFLPFVLVGLGVALFLKSKSLYLKEPLGKMGAVFVVLFPSVAIAQLMINSGGEQVSMVQHIAMLLSKLGTSFPVFAPFIGVMGAFITGSTTVSNVVFGPSQFQTAVSLSTDTSTILALQLVGASLGNAICLFNIIAAASVANIKDYKQVLASNLWPTLAATFVAGLLGLIYILFFLNSGSLNIINF